MVLSSTTRKTLSTAPHRTTSPWLKSEALSVWTAVYTRDNDFQLAPTSLPCCCVTCSLKHVLHGPHPIVLGTSAPDCQKCIIPFMICILHMHLRSGAACFFEMAVFATVRSWKKICSSNFVTWDRTMTNGDIKILPERVFWILLVLLT